MLRSWKIGGILLMAAVCRIVSAQGGRPNVSITLPSFHKVAFVPLPRIQASNVGFGIPGKNSSTWLMVLLKYKPAPAAQGRGSRGKKSASKAAAWIEQLDVDIALSFPAKQKANLGKKVLLTGTQRFWKVHADDRFHYVLFLVPPQIFAQYSNDSEGSLSQQPKNSVDDVASSVNILVRYKVGQSVLCTDACQAFVKGEATNEIKGQIWREIENLKRDRAVFKVEGGILPKARTPWEWVDAELFDLTVPETGGMR